ncbi:putative entry exclusion protein TrbK-alt [Inquilinus sp. NPDC058860]|uniref:putative entry exclusion protein TrbK-alt n=1 Tax=Inquilinus sp. NPDC058860 TaxID=3346652 RepID=UPI00369D5ADC
MSDAMEPGKVLRGAALAVLGAALLATAVAVHREPKAPAPVPRLVSERRDEMSAELARCRSLGLAAAEDPDCKAAGARARDRFLGAGEGER